MASDILHIKDGYYFDVPKVIWSSNGKGPKDFKHWFVRLDDDFQQWEADRTIEALKKMGVDASKLANLKHDWEHWQHESSANHAWSLPGYLEQQAAEIESKAATWAAKQKSPPRDPVVAYLAENKEEYAWFRELVTDKKGRNDWGQFKNENADPKVVEEYFTTPGANWSAEKLDAYNASLSGKVMIPQPFGELKNAYEPASGFCISKFMIIEVVVAVICILLFQWLAKRVSTGEAPKGKVWNFLEGFLVFIKEQIVVPAMGEEDAESFLPFFWTVFFFIFGCNLMGMLPWVGSPTAGFGLAAMMAVMVFSIGVFCGVREFGVLGYLKNICPSLGLPLVMSIFLVPMLWVIEFASLLIKHFILALRLVANMVAGHSVLLGIMGLAVGAHALTMSYTQWGVTAIISILVTTALSFLELLVAFLQAAIFTFLSALFISSAKHHH